MPVTTVCEKMEVTAHSIKKAVVTKESDGTILYEGYVNVDLVNASDQVQTESLKECLTRVPNLNVFSSVTYRGKNGLVRRYIVELEAPTPLLNIFKAMPLVSDAIECNKDVMITMKPIEMDIPDKSNLLMPEKERNKNNH